ncbi:MAG: hypothetical protein O8C66_12265 [Candidatus Methanoperedens sp.]|nr:hypothetical protein [Candidatus Methanoperedens sp.]MCZ7371274.1 hypothetical protein [Candidatus Methanoperedens sp.]
MKLQIAFVRTIQPESILGRFSKAFGWQRNMNEVIVMKKNQRKNVRTAFNLKKNTMQTIIQGLKYDAV